MSFAGEESALLRRRQAHLVDRLGNEGIAGAESAICRGSPFHAHCAAIPLCFWWEGSWGGTPERIRTSDLLLRRQTLYPAELRARTLFILTHAGTGPPPC